jgi:hypothetical protein
MYFLRVNEAVGWNNHPGRSHLLAVLDSHGVHSGAVFRVLGGSPKSGHVDQILVLLCQL